MTPPAPTIYRWHESLSEWTLSEDDIHLWLLDLEANSPWPDFPLEVLSPEDLRRFPRLTEPFAKKRFLRSSGLLRRLLGQALGLPPREVSWTTNRFGKPQLPDPAPLYFNLSHAQNLLFLAISAKRQLGVDLELCAPTDTLFKEAQSWQNFAHTHFTPQEFDAILKIAPDDQPLRIHQLWTAKEAVLKLSGLGLNAGMDSLSIHAPFDAPPRPPSPVPCPRSLQVEIHSEPLRQSFDRQIPELTQFLQCEGATIRVCSVASLVIPAGAQ